MTEPSETVDPQVLSDASSPDPSGPPSEDGDITLVGEHDPGREFKGSNPLGKEQRGR